MDLDDPREEMMWDIIRGEDGKNHREYDAVDDDDISSYLDLSGEGLQQEPVEEGQTNNDDEGNVIVDPSTTTGEVYILSLL